MTNLHKTVAIIEPVGAHGGMAYYDYGLCEALVNASCKVSLYTCDKTNPPENESTLFFPVYHGIYGNTVCWLRAIRYLRGSLSATYHAFKNSNQIFHLHSFHMGFTEIINILLTKLYFKKVVLTVHDVESYKKNLLPKFFQIWVYSLVDALIVHNHICAVEVQEKCKVPMSKISVIPHGNYLHVIKKIPSKKNARKILGISDQRKMLLFFGQIKEVKGLDLIIKAMQVVLKHHPVVLLMIAGRPWRTDFSRYENMIKEMGIEQSCETHIRYIEDDEVPLFFGACDLVLLPYRRIYQSGVVLMAMSYGKAVLVSDLDAMTEIVEDQKTGFVFNNGDVNDLAVKLNTVLEDDELRLKVARKGYEHVRDNYDWYSIGQATAKIYEKLLL